MVGGASSIQGRLPFPMPSADLVPGRAGALLVEVLRGGMVESEHRGALVLVDGDRTHGVGDVERPVWTRSAVKPFQAIASLVRGLADEARLTDAELAVLSASHAGSALHIAAVESLLAKTGSTADDLLCGPHPPFDPTTSRELARAGVEPGRIHNNCSGKHAGLLWLARKCGVPPEHYLDPDTASQREVRAVIGRFAEVPPASIDVAVDGCGAPTFRLPLVALARAFARLMNHESLAAVEQGACERLRMAITRSPVHLEGPGRLCTELCRALPGRIFPKNGAEGVFAFGLRGADGRVLGCAVKIADGGARAYPPVVVEAVRRLCGLTELPAGLAPFVRPPVRNTRDRTVGEVRCAVRWPSGW
jgi:L-asparaginase II